MKQFIAAAAIALAASLPAIGDAAAPQDEATRSWDDYEVVVDRSIFSRQRRAPRPAPQEPQSVEPTEQAPPPPPAPLQSHFVVVGVSISDGRTCAFIEDRRSGETHTVLSGDELAERQVTEISLDQVTITPLEGDEGEPAVIAVGRTLTGALPSGTSTSRSRTSASSPPPGSAGGSTAASDGTAQPASDAGDASESDGNLSILERLRRRRQQERQ